MTFIRGNKKVSHHVIQFVLAMTISNFWAVVHANHQYQQHKLMATDGQAEDYFGFSVAIQGDTVLVGAPQSDDPVAGLDVGSVHVYRRTEQGWQAQSKLTASDGLAGDTLGGYVALHGDTAVAGAIRHDARGENTGAAYVFRRSKSNWTQEAKLTAADGFAGDAFGQSIAVSDDLIVVGAPHDDDHGTSSGSVYVFKRVSGDWVQQLKLTAPDGAEGDVFGISIALDADTLLVGADLHDEGAKDAGAAYVFTRVGQAWHYQAKLTASDAGETDIFAVRVALSGNTALISARRDDDEVMGQDAGSAYVFERQGNKWLQQTKLTAPDGAADDRFGRGVVMAGNTALISAMHQDDQGDNSGSVYIYARNAGSWQLESQLTAKDGAPGDLFGWNVAMSGQTMLIGAPRHDQQGNESGAAYVIEKIAAPKKP